MLSISHTLSSPKYYPLPCTTHHRLHHQRRLRTPNETARRGKGWGSLFIPDVVLAYITYGILHDDADVLEDEDDDGIATVSETAR